MLESVAESATLRCPPSRQGVLSWNSAASGGFIEVQPLSGGAALCDWLPFARWTGHDRRSFSAKSGTARVDVDVLIAREPFDGVAVRSPGTAFDALALATPAAPSGPGSYAPPSGELNIPAFSQYAGEERGWCSPASLAMLLRYYSDELKDPALARSLSQVAKGVFDAAYGGTGNWSMNMAYAGKPPLRAFVAYLGDLDAAAGFIAARIPLVLSYGWRSGELDGAPLEQSAGHLAVLRGFDDGGNPLLNDPAAPGVRVTYPRHQLEPLWQRSGAIAYVIAPAAWNPGTLVPR